MDPSTIAVIAVVALLGWMLARKKEPTDLGTADPLVVTVDKSGGQRAKGSDLTDPGYIDSNISGTMQRFIVNANSELQQRGGWTHDNGAGLLLMMVEWADGKVQGYTDDSTGTKPKGKLFDSVQDARAVYPPAGVQEDEAKGPETQREDIDEGEGKEKAAVDVQRFRSDMRKAGLVAVLVVAFSSGCAGRHLTMTENCGKALAHLALSVASGAVCIATGTPSAGEVTSALMSVAPAAARAADACFAPDEAQEADKALRAAAAAALTCQGQGPSSRPATTEPSQPTLKVNPEMPPDIIDAFEGAAGAAEGSQESVGPPKPPGMVN